MKNKTKLLLLFLLIIVLCVPIITIASTKIGILVTQGDSIKEKERLLEEKQEFLNSDQIEEKSAYYLAEKKKKKNKLSEKQLENQQTQEKIEKIINKFYKEEYNEIKREATNSDGIKDGTLNSNEPEAKLYNLIINIIETKELDSEELKVLKEFIRDSSSNIKGNDELKLKMQKVYQD